MSDWRNRILSYGTKPADQFTFNPDNPRGHGQSQRKAMKAALDEIGWIGVVVENVRTGYLIDGHERVWQALEANAEVPYIQVDLSEEEEAKALLTFDAIGGMAYYDKQRLAELKERADLRAKALRDMVGQRQKHAVQVDIDYSDLDPDLVLDVPDALFATDNEWDVPTLDSSLQAHTLDLPVTKWGSISRKAKIRGTLHFYTDDYKFDALWDDPLPVVNSKAVNVIEPNFSTNPQMPRAVVLWGVYRKRWLSRWWQVCGLRMFVDLNIERNFFDLALLGVPQGWKAYANRAYGDDLTHLEDAYVLAEKHAGEKPLYAIIGGRQETKDLCRQRGWLWIAEDSARARKESVADGQR